MTMCCVCFRVINRSSAIVSSSISLVAKEFYARERSIDYDVSWRNVAELREKKMKKKIFGRVLNELISSE